VGDQLQPEPHQQVGHRGAGLRLPVAARSIETPAGRPLQSRMEAFLIDSKEFELLSILRRCTQAERESRWSNIFPVSTGLKADEAKGG